MSVVDNAKRYNIPVILVHTLMALPMLKAIINNSYGIPLTIRIQFGFENSRLSCIPLHRDNILNPFKIEIVHISLKKPAFLENRKSIN